jgi:tetratricopeptide (TPR) repeat protein
MKRISLVIAALFLFALAPARGLAAVDEVAIRAASHAGFGRIAIDWPAPVRFETFATNDKVTIAFARAFRGRTEVLRHGLATYVAAAAIENDGKSLVLRLKRPVTVSAFMVKDKTVVIDLSPIAASKPPPRAAPKEASKARPKPVAKPAAAAPKPAPTPQKVRLAVSEKGGAVRVTFAWPHRVAYRIAEHDGTVRLAFAAPGEIDAAALARALPALSPAIETEDGRTIVKLTVPDGVHLKAFHFARSIALEARGMMVKPPDESLARALAAAKPAAAGPEEPRPAPAAVEASPPQAASEAVPVAPAAPAAPAPATALSDHVGVNFSATDSGASLRFDWPVATGAAVFRRGSALWIVFGAPTELDLSDPLAHGVPVLGALTPMTAKNATVLRLAPRAGLEPSVRRAGTAWIVDLKPQAAPPDAPIVVEPRPASVPEAVVFRVHDADAPVRLTDPEIGNLLVVPVGELGRGIDAPPSLVDFRTLPSVQGIVIRPLADNLETTVTADAVEITRPGGLDLSRTIGARLDFRRPAGAHALFDFAQWRRGKDADFADIRIALERAIVAAPKGARTAPRLALARFYFAHLFAAETLAVLDAVGRDDPQAMADPKVEALQGAACFLADALGCAGDALGRNALDGEAEVALWRGALAEARGDDAAAAKNFVAGVGLLPTYPRKLRIRFALAAAEAMLDTGQAALVPPLLELVLKDRPDRPARAMALYLSGRRAQAEGRLDEALALWDKAAALNDPPSRTRALYAQAMALLDAHRATRAETIKALDALRFAWRGDAFEFELLRTLGEMELADSNEGTGLDALQEAAIYFPDNPAAKDVRKEASDAFAALFLSAKGKDLSPVRSLAIYDQYHDLEPVGERCDKIVKTLIDRLVSVDLLDRAAVLLAEQVKHRLAGVDKARGATQLALLRLMDDEPAAAIAALDIDVGSDVPPDLARQRTQLRARALMQMNRASDALSLLSGDDSRDADRLRADIYWHGRNWFEAARTLTRLAGTPPADNKVDAETGRIVVSLAAALTLDDNKPALAKLRSGFGAAMAGSRYGDAFRVLVGNGAPQAGGGPDVIAKQVAQIGELQSFMSATKQKLAGDAKPGAVN